MRSLDRNILAGLALSALMAVPARAEEMTIVSKRTVDQAPPQTETTYIGSDRMRAGQGDHEFIVEFASGQMTFIDHKKKEYSILTKQDQEAVGAAAGAQMKKMEAQMAAMPPAQREQMQKMMGGMLQSIELTKGTGGRTIVGHACQNWTMSFGGMVKNDMCVSSDVAVPVQAYEGFKSFSTAFSGGSAMGKNMTQMFDKFKEMKGFPLASTTTTNVMGKTSVTSTEVTEIRSGSIPASAWVLPAGYKKVDSPMLKIPRS
jgi:hypothetical protein